MKLILQIALGVFLGGVAAQFVMDSWHHHLAELAKQAADAQQQAEDQLKSEQTARIRQMLLESRQAKPDGKQKLPSGFVPDDTQ